uniref:Uncharacterized protein n=1 Tax=Amphimedon queenslandica TaxID=400682 RepID=A0A1X7TX29_AMPQE
MKQVPEPEIEGHYKIHYLSHHAVIQQGKETTEICIVYVASATSNVASLNECLHIGPKLNQQILEILLRFTFYRIALIAHIEKAFRMVSIDSKDRDVLRLTWYD